MDRYTARKIAQDTIEALDKPGLFHEDCLEIKIGADSKAYVRFKSYPAIRYSAEDLIEIANYIKAAQEAVDSACESEVVKLNLKETLAMLLAIYDANRCTGQTTALVQLLKQDSNSILIVSNEEVAQLITKANNLEPGSVISINRPASIPEGSRVFIDGSVIMQLAYAARDQ